MSFWIDVPAETDEERVYAWRQGLHRSVATFLDAYSEVFAGDYSPVSLEAFEEFVLEEVPDPRRLLHRSALPFVAPAIGYLGEALMWAGGGRWVWGAGQFAGMPCVTVDPALAIEPLSPLLVMIKAVRTRDGQQFARVRGRIEAAVAERRKVDHLWVPTKEETPGLAAMPDGSAMADSPDLLVALVITVAEHHGYSCEIMPDDAVTVHGNGRSGLVLYMGNLRRKVASEPQDQWPAMVADHLSTAFTGWAVDTEEPLDFGNFDQVRSLIRTRMYPDGMEGPDVVRRTVAPGIEQRILIDQVNTMATVSTDLLSRWPIQEHELFELAAANTRGDGRLEFDRDVFEWDEAADEARIDSLTGSADYASAHIQWLGDYPVVGQWGTLFVVPYEGVIYTHPIDGMDALLAVGKLGQLAITLFADRPSPVSSSVYWWHDGVVELAAGIHETDDSLEIHVSPGFQRLTEGLSE